MDTLHLEPQSFHSPRGGRPLRDHEARRIDEVNLSEVEVFMLRGRRLQAQAVGEAVRRAFAKLRRLLRHGHGDAGAARQPGRHRHA
jgi:hypothetical protein